jgi:lipoprotein LprG
MRALRTRTTAPAAQVTRLALAVLTVAALAALAACSGSDKAQGTTPTEQLAAAKAKVDAATSLHLTLTSSGIPETVNGALGAEGTGTHAPAFKGTLNARISGFEARVDVVAIDKLLYVKLPFTTGFTQVDAKTYNAPDPAQLFATQGGISSLLTATQNPVEGPKIRVGSDVLATITGTLPGATVAKLLNVGDAGKPFSVTYGITDPGNELRTVKMTGPFYKGATSTYTLTLDKYGAPVEISKP